MAQSRQLVLASTSPYRRALLERLQFQFECAAPGVDEEPRPAEGAAATAARLARAKARAVMRDFPDALIIGSDQVAELDGLRLDKPGTHERATAQLRAAAGRTVAFHTAVALYDARRNEEVGCRVVSCMVDFRALTDAQIENYLERERPYDCAGSAKSEGLGVALMTGMHTADPTSLIGLPLIALTDLLAAAGLPVLA